MTAEVLDLLIVGGGPAGTSAAFRARELGLEALIIEHDDLMKRIRDYSKDKLILPSFGGGDQMGFPRAGQLIECLQFQPIDKDDMCAAWKALHEEHEIRSRVGVELTGLKRRPDGIYEAQGWDHRQRCEATLLAAHVVLAIGRGVPRRFDIPGSTDGIAFRLTDPGVYVGQPACVIGGGTSAAEAVIGISHAKKAAGDSTAIYWSYRGDKMPRVSRALADEFFSAYVGNGNIRYYPRSEPVAVVTDGQRREYLSLQIDRRRMDGRPSETSHLEFPKEHCLACIGEDIPETLLHTFGIHMANGGPRNRKRMVVNRYLESQQPNVYLVGDILSQAYFETDDFNADPAGFREVKHRGNIKSALRDGVLVASVIEQRLKGRSEIDIHIEDAEEVAPQPPVMAGYGRPVDAAGPPAESLEAARRPVEATGYLIRLLPGGIEEAEYPIVADAVLTLGRGEDCDASFPSDTLLSPRHASISHTDEGHYLRDDGSASGVFLRLPSRRKLELSAGDLLRAGRQFLLLSESEASLTLTHFDAAGKELATHTLPQGTIVLGRQAPDITLDPDDSTLSRRQLAITRTAGGTALVKDLKSVNGTYLRVRSAIPIQHRDQFRIGQQLFVFSLKRNAVLDAGHAAPTPVTPPAPAAPRSTEQVSAPGSLPSASITFRGLGKTLPVAPGQTICEVAEAHGLAINAECHSGICGSDPIRVHAGHKHLVAPPSDGESETLEDICDLEPGPCRLACMARVTGPVEVEIL
ncbi:MAG: FHA domain-containing protein [Acidobacteriota bacterium]